MLVRKSRLTAAEQRIHDLEVQLALSHANTLEAQRRLEAVDYQFRAANESYLKTATAAADQNRQLYERLITAEGEGRKASALIAMWTVRVNQLQSERDQLLVRLLPGLPVDTPFIGTRQVPDPLESFEHNEADHERTGDPSNLIPVDAFADPFAGTLAGEIYTPPTGDES